MPRGKGYGHDHHADQAALNKIKAQADAKTGHNVNKDMAELMRGRSTHGIPPVYRAPLKRSRG